MERKKTLIKFLTLKMVLKLRHWNIIIFSLAFLIIIFLPTASLSYTYTCMWNGTMENLTHIANQSVESFSDAANIGTCNNFITNDPHYTSLNHENINTWRAATEFPGVYVVHNGNMGFQKTYGTWIFTPPIPPISSGISVATVMVNSINTISNSDWFGPYYEMYVSAHDPNVPQYPMNDSFGGGQGCSNCWTQTFAFPSNSKLTLNLTLKDNQSNYGSGMVYVNINGASATDTINIAGITDTAAGCGIALQGSSCSMPVGAGQASIDTSGNSGSRTASAQIEVNVQDLFAFQDQQEQNALSSWAQLAGSLNTYFSGYNNPNSCTERLLNSVQNWDQAMQHQMIFWIAGTMFGAMPYETGYVFADFLLEFGNHLIWDVAAKASTQNYANTTIGESQIVNGLPTNVSFNCTSDPVAWDNGDGGSNMQADLQPAINDAGSLLNEVSSSGATTTQYRSGLHQSYSDLDNAIGQVLSFANKAENYYQAFGQSGGDDISEFAHPLINTLCGFEQNTISTYQAIGGTKNLELNSTCTAQTQNYLGNKPTHLIKIPLK